MCECADECAQRESFDPGDRGGGSRVAGVVEHERAHHADGALGEVDDSGSPVREHDSERGQAVHRTGTETQDRVPKEFVHSKSPPESRRFAPESPPGDSGTLVLVHIADNHRPRAPRTRVPATASKGHHERQRRGRRARDARTATAAAITADTSPTRRELILESAIRLFRTNGYDATGIDEIGAAAGITGPGVYRHFSSKQEILDEAVIHGISHVLQHADAILEGELPAREALDALVAGIVEDVLDRPDQVTVLLRERRHLSANGKRAWTRAASVTTSANGEASWRNCDPISTNPTWTRRSGWRSVWRSPPRSTTRDSRGNAWPRWSTTCSWDHCSASKAADRPLIDCSVGYSSLAPVVELPESSPSPEPPPPSSMASPLASHGSPVKTSMSVSKSGVVSPSES